jgi:serine/threonine-protein kinase
MLTGSPPFTGDTVIELIVNACTQPLQFPQTVPADCRRLIELMMAKEPEQRLPDGDAVVVALEDVAKGRPSRLPEEMTSGEYAASATAAGRTPLPARRRRVLRRYRYRR